MTPFADLLICLRFLSRLPVPATRREIALGASGLAAAAAMVPVAGAVLGATQALALALASDLPPTVAAILAVAAGVAVTGALHEDGLADCADGFGGGRDRDAKLAIMRDSRIGAYGATAVGLSLLLRSAALAAILEGGQWSSDIRDLARGAAALVLAGAVSRAGCLLPLFLLPPARPDGLAAAAGRPAARVLVGMAAAAAAVAAVAAGWLGAPRVVAALAAAAVAVAGLSALAKRQISGHTGDVAGAAQQLAEMAVLLVLSAR